MWYVDCFVTKGGNKSSSPAASYYHGELEVVVGTAQAVLKDKKSGIGKVSIAQETMGQSPMLIRVSKK